MSWSYAYTLQNDVIYFANSKKLKSENEKFCCHDETLYIFTFQFYEK